MKMFFELPVFLSVCIVMIASDDIFLKCDESDNGRENQEAFCTVSGFYVTHSQNVKMQSSLRANMTKFMKFYDSRLLYLPFKLFEHFPNLRTLDVSFTEILDIPRNTFASANNLSFLNMSNNNITTIETSVFIGASSLIRIDLSRNFIEDINPFTFRGLVKIDKIQLSYNRIKELHKDIFLENQYMESVALDNNCLESIDPEVFSKLQRIREVNLANNRLLHLHPNTFQAAFGIETLILSGNKLTNFTLTEKSILLSLDLDHNNLTSLIVNSTKTVRAKGNRISSITVLNSHFLEKLVLSSNSFTDISNITSLASLTVLDLSYNSVGSLNITTFDKLRRLRELSLRSTHIPKISFGMFSKQTNLETLDLSFNNITDLNLNVFSPYLSKIKYFYIDGNNLTEISGRSALSYVFPALVRVGLSKNRFNCTYLHTILSPPYLSSFVELHIEPEVSTEEATHIRDITCITTKSRDGMPANTDEESQIEVLKSTIKHLQIHGHHLEIFLITSRILVLILIIIFIAGLIMKYGYCRRRRCSGQFGRNGSIVFRSSATVNSAMEH